MNTNEQMDEMDDDKMMIGWTNL